MREIVVDVTGRERAGKKRLQRGRVEIIVAQLGGDQPSYHDRRQIPDRVTPRAIDDWRDEDLVDVRSCRPGGVGGERGGGTSLARSVDCRDHRARSSAMRDGHHHAGPRGERHFECVAELHSALAEAALHERLAGEHGDRLCGVPSRAAAGHYDRRAGLSRTEDELDDRGRIVLL